MSQTRLRLRPLHRTQLLIALLSAGLILAAVVFQVLFGQIADIAPNVCHTDMQTGATTDCLYNDGYVLSKAVQAFAPGAFVAGLIGVLLVLLLRGLSQIRQANLLPMPTSTSIDTTTVDTDPYRRPVETI